MTASSDATAVQTKLRRLSRSEESEIVSRARRGESHVAIAAGMDIAPRTVSRVLARWRDTREEARAYLEAQALSAAEQWVQAIPKASKRGKHQAARDLLAGIGVTEQPVNAGITVQVGIALPGLPGGSGIDTLANS